MITLVVGKRAWLMAARSPGITTPVEKTEARKQEAWKNRQLRANGRVERSPGVLACLVGGPMPGGPVTFRKAEKLVPVGRTKTLCSP